MQRRFGIAAAALLATAACSSTNGTRPGAQRGSAPPSAAVSVGVSLTLDAEQASAVRNYYATLTAAQGRGRARGLPPGIASNLERGKPLPPGIAKHYLPNDLAARLPRLPSGLDYVIMAGKLLIVEAATQAVREVLLDLAFG
jgi:hypothetical protein